MAPRRRASRGKKAFATLAILQEIQPFSGVFLHGHVATLVAMLAILERPLANVPFFSQKDRKSLKLLFP